MKVSFNRLPKGVRERFVQLTRTPDQRVVYQGPAHEARGCFAVMGFIAMFAAFAFAPMLDKRWMVAAVMVLPTWWAMGTLAGFIVRHGFKATPFVEGDWVFASHAVRARADGVHIFTFDPNTTFTPRENVAKERHDSHTSTRRSYWVDMRNASGSHSLLVDSEVAARGLAVRFAQAKNAFFAEMGRHNYQALQWMNPFYECTVAGSWYPPGLPAGGPELLGEKKGVQHLVSFGSLALATVLTLAVVWGPLQVLVPTFREDQLAGFVEERKQKKKQQEADAKEHRKNNVDLCGESWPIATTKRLVCDRLAEQPKSYKSLARLVHLEDLDLSGAEITDLKPLRKLLALESLSLYGAKVKDLKPLAKLSRLESLSLGHTEVSDLSPLAGLVNLETLTLPETKVSDLSPIAKLTKLKTLDVATTQVADLSPLRNLTKLTYLVVGGTRINSLAGVENLTELETLDLWTTGVSDLTPVQKLTKLRKMWASDTKVQSVSPLRDLVALRELNLSRTPVSDLSPLVNAKALKISANGSKIDRAEMKRFESQRPGCSVYID